MPSGIIFGDCNNWAVAEDYVIDGIDNNYYDTGRNDDNGAYENKTDDDKHPIIGVDIDIGQDGKTNNTDQD